MKLYSSSLPSFELTDAISDDLHAQTSDLIISVMMAFALSIPTALNKIVAMPVGFGFQFQMG